MTSIRPSIAKTLAVLLVLAVTQLYVQVGLAGPALAPDMQPAAPFQGSQAVLKLITRGNQPILVNGNSATTGATLLTGALIETPDNVGATVNLGALGTLDIAPNTKLRIDIDDNGDVKVTLISGCAILRTKRNHQGTIDTTQGEAGKTDKERGGVLDVCFPPGATSAVVGQGAAASAGAGAAGSVAGTAGVAAASQGLTRALIVTLLAGAAGAVVVAAIIANSGNGPGNPSPGRPT